MKKLLYIILITLFALSASATDYYFANAPVGAGNCTLGNACTTTMGSGSVAQAIIDNATEESTLYFNKGDTWTVDSTANITTHGLLIGSDDEIIHIDAYGAGDDPIFDGGVTDFSTADPHDAGTGPLLWSNLFKFNKAGCSVKNVEIKQMYGRAIETSASNFTATGNNIHHFGADAISNGTSDCGANILVESNLLYEGQQLYRYGLRAGWGAAISFQRSVSECEDTIVRYNVVYDIYGEGIIIHDGTVEYNFVGDTYSAGIYYNGTSVSNDNDILFRYNLVTSSSSGTYRYITYGIGWFDERANGDATGSDVEIYGNVVINRTYGIRIRQQWGSDEAVDSMKIYNNTVIDSSTWNYELYMGNDTADAGYFYNNASIFYHRPEKHVNDDATSKTNWTISHNLYWTPGIPAEVDSDWNTSYQRDNPLLAGEEQGSPVDWTALATGDPRGLVT